MNQQDDYKILLRHFITVVRSMKGQPVEEEWMILAEGMAMKLFGHVSSLLSLYQGTKLQIASDQFLDFVDHASINVLTRAAFETSLAFHFIFCEPTDADERDFRFMCWDYAGFLERQGFPTNTDEGRELKASEAKALDELDTKIQAHPRFAYFTDKLQKKILEGEWRPGRSWTSIAVSAGYSKEYFKSTYSYLCGYAHTGRLSVLQITQARTRDTQHSLADVCIGYGCIIMSNFLFGYASLFQNADQAFRSHRLAYQTAQMWREIGQDISNGSNGG